MKEELSKIQAQSNGSSGSPSSREESQMDRVREELLRKVDAFETRKMEEKERMQRTLNEVVEELKEMHLVGVPADARELLEKGGMKKMISSR